MCSMYGTQVAVCSAAAEIYVVYTDGSTKVQIS